MAYSLEDILAFHGGNQQTYDELKTLFEKNPKKRIPFIGAGLSGFAYPGWGETLKKIAKKVTDSKKRQEIEDQIEAGGDGYFDAAESLQTYFGDTDFAEQVAQVFYPKRLEEEEIRDQIPRQAVELLPLLFPRGLKITTNFDQLLEKVYSDARQHLDVFHPGHSELLEQALDNPAGGNVLFKLHGSLAGIYIESSHLVFTKKQYDEHYGAGKPLRATLEKCFREQNMLFLGCSLAQDRTLDILREVQQAQESNGETPLGHYAILSCKPGEQEKRVQELRKLHIYPILYEEKKFTAVRILLEKLLEDCRPEDYTNLPHKLSALQEKELKNRFLYNSGFTQLHGRKEEM
ncbi:MAG: SIR2 family protein, partial [Firmicutes bacterium]|nr:SIR2 family protein [Bacillota bacterium]